MAVAAIAGAVLAGCGTDDKASPATATTASTEPGSGSGPSASTIDSSGSSTTSSTTPAPSKTVQVYFTRGGSLVASGRTVSGVGVARAALDAVMAGPNDIESTNGMQNGIPAGTKVLGLTIADGSATVDLSGQFTSGGGSLSMQLRVAQVVFTLTQFPTVDTITIHIDGKAVDGIGGEGMPANTIDRSDVENVTPSILVTSPFPGAKVKPAFTVTGIANTFEATVLWSVVGSDGTEWDAGFTTATAGSGTWGTYEISIDLADHTGTARLKVFEEDAESGGERNAVEVPITVG